MCAEEENFEFLGQFYQTVFLTYPLKTVYLTIIMVMPTPAQSIQESFFVVFGYWFMALANPMMVLPHLWKFLQNSVRLSTHVLLLNNNDFKAIAEWHLKRAEITDRIQYLLMLQRRHVGCTEWVSSEAQHRFFSRSEELLVYTHDPCSYGE